MALIAENPNCFCKRRGKIVVEDADHDVDRRVDPPRFDGHLQIQAVVLRAEDDRPRAADAGRFEQFFLGAVARNNGDIQPAGIGDQFGGRAEFDRHDVLLHLVQLVGDPEAQVPQADQDDVIVEGGCYGHFPLLAPRAAVEKQRPEIGQTMREGDHADHRHDEMEQLQDGRMREIPHGFKECGGQHEENGFDRVGKRFTDLLREAIIQEARCR